ncbi:hypothetical protein CRT22_23750 [Escherichia sp. E5028]|uniref:hypothetical protein n=1 Tax=Escherichia sp. E5028 TaxID=2044602 RepID=UPI00107F2EE1|nr:hypothetical protein [Escherichia sp. E5028]TGB52829.1 hypothetical protein CRT22_23750 [Escherichia sp. E5028]
MQVLMNSVTNAVWFILAVILFAAFMLAPNKKKKASPLSTAAKLPLFRFDSTEQLKGHQLISMLR